MITVELVYRENTKEVQSAVFESKNEGGESEFMFFLQDFGGDPEIGKALIFALEAFGRKVYPDTTGPRDEVECKYEITPVEMCRLLMARNKFYN